jgi:hypothetical protein
MGKNFSIVYKKNVCQNASFGGLSMYKKEIKYPSGKIRYLQK